MAVPVAELRAVSRVYPTRAGTVVALDRVSLAVSEGDFCLVTGRSGSGKSTLLAALGGLTSPTMGTVRLFGREVNELVDEERARLRATAVGFVFQFSGLLPTLSAFDNVRLATLFGVPAGRGTDLRARELLRRVGLGDRLTAWPNELSGGEQRRVAIARALLAEPRLLLADEPTGDLDTATEGEIMDLLGELHAEGLTIVMVTHNLDLRSRGNRWVELTDGRITGEQVAA